MTVKTKRYIELADVLTLMLTCKGCGSSLEIPISVDLSRNENIQKLDSCPVCLRPWVSRNGDTYHKVVAELPVAITKLRNVMETAKLGFDLAIEVSNDKPEGEKP
jgi:hypothetical protein